MHTELSACTTDPISPREMRMLLTTTHSCGRVRTEILRCFCSLCCFCVSIPQNFLFVKCFSQLFGVFFIFGSFSLFLTNFHLQNCKKLRLYIHCELLYNLHTIHRLHKRPQAYEAQPEATCGDHLLDLRKSFYRAVKGLFYFFELFFEKVWIFVFNCDIM